MKIFITRKIYEKLDFQIYIIKTHINYYYFTNVVAINIKYIFLHFHLFKILLIIASIKIIKTTKK